MFTQATREQNRLRMALFGPSGSGKTYTALRFAFGLCPQGKIAVVDTEHGKSKLYIGEAPDGIPWQFVICEPVHFAPSSYENIIKHAGQSGFDVLVIDSLSHAWMGVGGALEQVDKAKGNNFDAWRDVTPQHNSMVESILASPCHVIATLRSHMEYVMEKDERGKTVIRKVGLKPIQRAGMEYEFDLVGDLDLQHTMTISKTRCSALDGKVFNHPDASLMPQLKEWLLKGSPRKEPAAATMVVQAAPLAATIPINGATVNQGEANRCFPSTQEQIKGLAQALGWTPEKLKEVLSQKGASRLAELSQEDASSLAEILTSKLATADSKKVF